MEQIQPTEQGQREAAHCYWHPEVETGLSCSRCSRSVCAQCMVQAPVGIRCRECGRAVPMPTYQVSTSYYARAIGIAAVAAVGGGIIWTLLNVVLLGTILSYLVAVGLGYTSGELISRSVNRKRSNGLAWLAGGSVVVAFLIAWGATGFNPFFARSIWGLLLLFGGVFLAIQRVRR